MRRTRRFWGKVLATILLVLLTILPLDLFIKDLGSDKAAVGPSFSFGAGGDFGILYNSGLVFERVSSSGTSFFLALGDMDYDMSWTDSLGRTYNGGNDADFCRFVTDRLGTSYPFELVAGNHESQGGPDGYILNHAACLPDRLGSTGVYAAEYYFDYPTVAPLVRVVMIAAGLTVDNIAYDYWAGNARYLWLSGVIDQARAQGIPWVVVGMHKNCLAIGAKGCEIGPDLMNLLITKRVDLVLQGHDHNYQRGKQLTCATVGTFVSSCVADDGSDNAYPKGAGTIFIVQGMSGRCCYPVNPSDSEVGYFAAWDSVSNGFMKYTVSSQSIDVAFVATTGSYSDSFTITDGSPPPPPISGGVNWRTVNYDPSFDTPEISENAGARPADWDYWAPAARNGCGIGTSTSQISDGALHVRQSNPTVTDWNCYGNAVAHQGHFPWMRLNNLGSHCSDQMLGADFDCPRGIHGLQEPAHTDFQLNASWQVSFLSRGSPSGGAGEYNVLAAGFYFYFTDGPVGPLNRRILEAQVRLAAASWSTGCSCWVNEPVGKETTWDPGFDYGYSLVVAQLDPGQSSAVVDFDLDEFYRKALAKWGLAANTHALLVGIEPGTEGFGAIVNADFHYLEVEALLPEPARADMDFDHDVDTSDLSLVQSLVGKCPESDWGVYQWRADSDSASDDPLVPGHSHCIDSFDTSLVSNFLGQNYSDLLGTPVLVVPGSQSVNEGQLLQFSVTGSDLNPAETVTLSASDLPAGASFPTVTGNPVTGSFAWTPVTGQVGTYMVTFTAVDNGIPNFSSTRTVTITVSQPSVCSPLAYPTDRWQRVWYDRTLTTCLGNGPDEANVQFDNNWLQGVVAWSRGDNIGFKSGRTISLPTTGTYIFSVGSDDGVRVWIDDALVLDKWFDRGYAVDVFSRSLAAGSHRIRIDFYENKLDARISFSYTPPTTFATSFTFVPLNPAAGTVVTFTATATGGTLPYSFSWNFGDGLSAVGNPVSHSYSAAGSYTVSLTAGETGGQTATASNIINVASGVNAPPVLDPIGDKTVDEESTITVVATATDPDGDTLTFSLLAGAPSGASITSTGVFQWTPSESQGPNMYHVEIIVSDGVLTDSGMFMVTVREVNAPPVVNVPGPSTATVGVQLAFTVTATDPDLPANILTLQALGLPTGATFDPATGRFLFTPLASQAGLTFTITFTANDNGQPSLSTSKAVEIVVSPPENQPPVLSSIGDKAVDEETELSFTTGAVDPNGDPLTFSLGIGTPEGASITASGLFTWNPSEAQGPNTYQITIVVRDNGSPALPASETITVTVRETNKPPVLTVPGSFAVGEGEKLTFTVAVTDPDLPANIIIISAIGLPLGSSFDSTTGVFVWTPSGVQGEETYTMTFTATDNGSPAQSASQQVAVLASGSGGGEPPIEGPCIRCLIPATWIPTLTLLIIGGLAGLILSITVMASRARKRLEIARRLRELPAINRSKTEFYQ